MFEQLKEKIKDKKVILLGELHGTKEIPQVILDFLKSLDEEFNLLMEIPDEFQKNIEEFYKEPSPDGRNSKEYLDLIKTLNKKLYCIDSFAKNQEEKEENLAKNILDLSNEKKTIAILGEIHASKEKINFGEQEIIPTGNILKEKLKGDLLCVRIKPSKGKYFNFEIKDLKDSNDEFDKNFDYVLNIGEVSPCSFIK